MTENEKRVVSTLLAQMGSILEIAEEAAENLLAETLNRTEHEGSKNSTQIAELIKLIQLLEKQYIFLKRIEKEQELTQEIPVPNEAMMRQYLNQKHHKKSRAEKALSKHKHQHV